MTTPSATADAIIRPQRAKSEILGLPAKLALTALGMIVVCVGGVTWYADQQMRDASTAAVRAEASSASSTISTRLVDADFASGSTDASGIAERVTQNLDALPPNSQVTLYATPRTGTPQLITSSGNTPKNPPIAINKAATSGAVFEQVIKDGRQFARLSTPYRTGGESSPPIGVVQVDVPSAALETRLQHNRQMLWLGAGIGASMLGFLLLLTLQVELFRPLEQMRAVMDLVRSGAKGVRIGWTRGDEIGATARDFDRMLGELEAAELELAKFVNLDPLTGLLNEIAFADRLGGELTRARREGHHVAYMLLDIDDLAGINDAHGHDSGDNVLRALAETVQACVRPTDVCGRVGGDRIVIGLIGADAVLAATVLERLQSEIAARVRISGATTTFVSASIGVATFPEDTADQRELARLADAALEHARGAGSGNGAAFAWAAGGKYIDMSAPVSGAGSATTEDRSAVAEREFAASIHTFARALESRTDSRAGHGQRVARYAELIADHLELADSHVRELKSAAIVHEVGAVGGHEPLSAEGVATATRVLAGANLTQAAGWLAEIADGPSATSSREAAVLAVADFLDEQASFGELADLDALLAQTLDFTWLRHDEELRDAVTMLVQRGQITMGATTTSAAPTGGTADERTDVAA